MTVTAARIAIVLAGALDVAWAISMKRADGFTRLSWTLASIAALVSFAILLGYALKLLPVGFAHAAWAGIGAVGTLLAGSALFGEAIALQRAVSVALVMVGTIGLKAETA